MKTLIQSNSKGMGYVYGVVASAIYALNSVLGKIILGEGLEPLEIIFYQYLFSSVFVFIFLFFTDRSQLKLPRKEIGQTAIQGILGAFGTNFFFFMALKSLNAGIVSMLLFTNPIFITLFFAVTGIKKLDKANYVSLLLAMVGTVLVLNLFSLKSGAFATEGIVFGMLSALTYAFYNIYADFKLARLNHFTVLLYTSLFGLAVALMSLLVVNGGIPLLSLELMKYVFLISVVAGILPVICFYKSVAMIGSERTSIVATLEIPLTLVAAFFILQEHMTINQLMGVLLVVLAALLLHYKDSKS